MTHKCFAETFELNETRANICNLPTYATVHPTCIRWDTMHGFVHCSMNSEDRPRTFRSCCCFAHLDTIPDHVHICYWQDDIPSHLQPPTSTAPLALRKHSPGQATLSSACGFESREPFCNTVENVWLDITRLPRCR